MRIFARVITVLVSTRYVSAGNCNKNANQIESPVSATDQLKHVATKIVDQDIPTVRPRNRCCPYDFDSSLCKTVGHRLLCGYNMNRGYPYDSHGTLHLNDGCRLRDGRLECGYETSPFTNSRRPPPVWDDLVQYSENDVDNTGLIVTPNNLKPHHTKRRQRRVTRCVEIQTRIVCRHV